MVNMLLKNTVTGGHAKVLGMKHSKEGFWHEEQQGSNSIYTKAELLSSDNLPLWKHHVIVSTQS